MKHWNSRKIMHQKISFIYWWHWFGCIWFSILSIANSSLKPSKSETRTKGADPDRRLVEVLRRSGPSVNSSPLATSPSNLSIVIRSICNGTTADRFVRHCCNNWAHNPQSVAHRNKNLFRNNASPRYTGISLKIRMSRDGCLSIQSVKSISRDAVIPSAFVCKQFRYVHGVKARRRCGIAWRHGADV